MTVRVPILALSLLAVAGCGSRAEPLVDRINVSDAKYNSDLAACREQGSSWLPFGGTSLADCMKGKGYRVLMGSSRL